MNKKIELFDKLEVTRYNLSMQIADKVQRIIESKNLEPGTKLPSERKLAEKLGVNRVTLSKAILLLEQKGLVTIKTGDGTYISDVPSSVVTDSIKNYYKHGKGSDRELMILREILEPEIAALAAINAEEDEIKNLEKQIRIVKETFELKDKDRYILEDEIFHENLAQATHNDLIAAIIIGLRSVMLPLKRTLINKILIDKKHAVHTRVLKAIIARDPETARKVFRDDIKAVIVAADL